MSVTRAFEKLRQSLPAVIVQRVSEKLAADPACHEVTVEGFALCPVKNAKNLEFLLERRATGSPEGAVRQAVQEKHDFVAKALRDGTQDHLWQGYVVTDGKHASLLVNLATGEALKVCLG
jgi:hypothetical protein